MSSTLRHLILLILLREVVCEKLLSLNKRIRSSSTHTSPNQNWDPRNAVDGNHTNTPNQCKCCAATSRDRSPWYELDLGRKVLIERIDVEGRAKQEVASHHLGGMEIFLASESEIENGTAITKVASKQHNFDFTLAEKRESRYVTVIRRNIRDYFLICELSVYGDCVDGEFGQDCGQRCHCDGKPCNRATGVCPSGKCLPGFTGPACDRECVDGEYGPDCGQHCHCEGEPCNKTTGVCPSGKCLAGFTGLACNIDCVDGEYGPDCGQRCHCEGEPCNKTTGVCPSGKCLAGFTGPACDKACPDGHFGINCSSNCGNCLNGTPCTKDSGFCKDGCECGFIPPLCVEENVEASRPEVKIYQVGTAIGGASTLIMIGVVVAGIFYVIRLRKRYRSTPTSAPDISGPYELPNRSAVESEHQYGQTAPIYEEAESSYEIPK